MSVSKLVGIMNCRYSSAPSGSISYSTGISAIQSGSPSAQPSGNSGAGGTASEVASGCTGFYPVCDHLDFGVRELPCVLEVAVAGRGFPRRHETCLRVFSDFGCPRLCVAVVDECEGRDPRRADGMSGNSSGGRTRCARCR